MLSFETKIKFLFYIPKAAITQEAGKLASQHPYSPRRNSACVLTLRARRARESGRIPATAPQQSLPAMKRTRAAVIPRTSSGREAGDGT